MDGLQIRELLDEMEGDWLLADGFDEAIIGVSGDKVAYSITKCIEVLMKEMSEEEAVEYFDFNVLVAYVGEKTPIFVDDELFMQDCPPLNMG